MTYDDGLPSPGLPVSLPDHGPRFDTKNNAGLIARRTSPHGGLTMAPTLVARVHFPQGQCQERGWTSTDCYLSEATKQLAQLIDSKPGSRIPPMEDEAEDPKAQPIVWVSKWVDYSDKYGFGFNSLNDDSIGVVFNDLTSCCSWLMDSTSTLRL